MLNPPVKRVLVAVDDETGLEDFLVPLQQQFGAEVLCLGLKLPETLGSYGVAFAEADASQSAGALLQGVDMLVVNLSDFQEVVSGFRMFPQCVDMIEGVRVSLMQQAARLFATVSVVTDPSSYSSILEELATSGNGSLSYETRVRQAYDALQMVSDYDYDVAEWLGAKLGIKSE